MTTTTIIIILAVAVISWIMGFICAPTEINSLINPYWDYESKSNRLYLSEQDNNRLRDENMRLRDFYNNHYRFEEINYWRNKKCYAKTPDKQEVADILKTSFTSLEELAKKLEIKID